MGVNAVNLPAAMRASYGMTSSGGAGIGSGRNEGMATFSISKQTFERLEQFIADNLHSAEKAKMGIDLLVRGMALSVKGYAQQKAMGQVAPRQRSNPALAYRLPVQRITGAYFAGWKHRRVALGFWSVYNDSKEAILIEDGLHMRTRRPVLKMSVIGMLRLIQTTRTGDSFMSWVIAPRRNEAGKFASFNSRIQGSSVMGGLAGPTGTLPS